MSKGQKINLSPEFANLLFAYCAFLSKPSIFRGNLLSFFPNFTAYANILPALFFNARPFHRLRFYV